jgi:hypothetical protein
MPKKTAVVSLVPAEQKPPADTVKPTVPPVQLPKTPPVAVGNEPQKSPVPQAKTTVAQTAPQAVKPAPVKTNAVKPMQRQETNADLKKTAKALEKDQSKGAGKDGSGKVPSVQKSAVRAYLVQVGEYVLASQLARDREKVIRAGLEASVTKAGKKPQPMHRLLLSDYEDKAGAMVALGKLNAAGGEGFLLEESGHFSVYAGSYFLESKAVNEQKKFADRGIKLVIRKTTVPMAVSQLSAGRYVSAAEADKALVKLAQVGLKGKLVPLDGK